MNIRISDSARQVAIKALEYLVDENDAADLLGPARSLLAHYRKRSGEVTVDTASLSGEALATALEDLIDTGSLSEEEEILANELLDKF